MASLLGLLAGTAAGIAAMAALIGLIALLDLNHYHGPGSMLLANLATGAIAAIFVGTFYDVRKRMLRRRQETQ